MFNSNAIPSLSDIAAVTNGNDGFGGNNGWWLLIILFAIFGGWGNAGWGGYGGGIQENYVLTSDFSQLSRQISDAYGMTERKLDGINNGLCSGFYENARMTDSVNTNILTSTNAIQSQLAQCCCDTKGLIADVNYNLATQANNVTNAINSGFCQTNFNAQNNTRDIVDSQNAGTRAILDKLCQMESNAKDEKIADQAQKISSLQLAASQAAQNSYLVDKLGYRQPVPAFNVPAPWYTSCGCQGCGC